MKIAAAAVEVVPLPEVTKTVCAQATTACAYIVGPSGIPLPDETGPGSEPYDRVVMAWYVQPNSPVGTVFTTQVIQSAEGAYPIVLVSYDIVCPAYKDTKQAEFAKAWLTYVTSDEGQKAAQDAAGTAPLPSSLKSEITKSIEAIKTK